MVATRTTVSQKSLQVCQNKKIIHVYSTTATKEITHDENCRMHHAKGSDDIVKATSMKITK